MTHVRNLFSVTLLFLPKFSAVYMEQKRYQACFHRMILVDILGDAWPQSQSIGSTPQKCYTLLTVIEKWRLLVRPCDTWSQNHIWYLFVPFFVVCPGKCIELEMKHHDSYRIANIFPLVTRHFQACLLQHTASQKSRPYFSL